MTAQESINILQREIDCSASIDDDCLVVGTCEGCEHNTSKEERVEAFKMAIEAIINRWSVGRAGEKDERPD